jgi:hypothetical protein
MTERPNAGSCTHDLSSALYRSIPLAACRGTQECRGRRTEHGHGHGHLPLSIHGPFVTVPLEVASPTSDPMDRTRPPHAPAACTSTNGRWVAVVDNGRGSGAADSGTTRCIGSRRTSPDGPHHPHRRALAGPRHGVSMYRAGSHGRVRYLAGSLAAVRACAELHRLGLPLQLSR